MRTQRLEQSRLGAAKPSPDDRGASARVGFALKPGETRTVRFVLAWYAPVWVSSNHSPLRPNAPGGGSRYVNTYSARFKSAADVAEYLTQHHRTLLDRILAWQQIVYAEKKLPGWLQDGLINVLAILPQESFMMKSADPSHWWGDKGFFCVNESLMSCPQQSCIGNDQIGEWAVSLLFPELALRKLGAFRHYQKPDTGEPPSTLGAGTDADHPWYEQQLAMDGQFYVHMLERYRLSSGNDKMLDDWYPSVKACLRFMFTVDQDGDGLPDVHGGNHYLDGWPMEGAAPHVSSYWLATLKIAERMAKRQSDSAFADECRSRRESEPAVEQKL